VRVTVLGTTGAWPEAGRACSGLLVESGESRLVLDLGFATLPRLLAHTPVSRLTGVFVTHAHADHCVDLYGLYRAVSLSGGSVRSPRIYGPAEVLDRLGPLDGPGGVERLRATLDFHALTAESTIEIGPFRLRTRALPHFLPNFGVRVEAEGQAIAYTGDTGPADAVAELAEGCDLFVCEAMDLEPGTGDRARFLLTPAQAAGYATRAKVRRLLLTHFAPGTEREPYRAAAAAGFSGPILLADEDQVLSVP
jgi:ribonuclease BN (tRNA processing enzyme)